MAKSIDTALSFTHYASFLGDAKRLFIILILLPLVFSGLSPLLGMSPKEFLKVSLIVLLLPSLVFIALWIFVATKRYVLAHGILLSIIGSIILGFSMLLSLFFNGEIMSRQASLLALPLLFIGIFYSALLLFNNIKHSIVISFVLFSLYGIAILTRVADNYVEFSYDLVLSSLFVAGISFFTLKVIEAPLKKQYGISITDVAGPFFAEWYYGGDTKFESLLDKIGNDVITYLAGLKIEKDGQKLMLLVPFFHFGPFGNIGSSRFPSDFFKLYEGMVLHGTATHHMNLTSGRQVVKVLKELKDLEGKELKEFHYASYKEGHATCHLLGFGKEGCLALLTRTPKTTEDISFSGGLILMESLRKHYDVPIVADCHNSSARKITYFSPTSEEFLEYYDVISKVEPRRGNKFLVGFARSKMDNPQVDAGGVSVLVFETRNDKVMLVTIDTNGIKNKARETIEAHGSSLGYKTIVCTTDAHGKNVVGGAVNDLSLDKKNEETILKTMKDAISSLGSARVEVFKKKVKVRVVGDRQLSEILATINSVWAVTKLVIPTALILMALGFFFLF